MRVAFAILMVVWLILKFILHKGGYVHMFLIAAISILIVQFIADRNARYHRTSDERQSSV